jgi:hypothetical protein
MTNFTTVNKTSVYWVYCNKNKRWKVLSYYLLFVLFPIERFYIICDYLNYCFRILLAREARTAGQIHPGRIQEKSKSKKQKKHCFDIPILPDICNYYDGLLKIKGLPLHSKITYSVKRSLEGQYGNAITKYVIKMVEFLIIFFNIQTEDRTKKIKFPISVVQARRPRVFWALPVQHRWGLVLQGPRVHQGGGVQHRRRILQSRVPFLSGLSRPVPLLFRLFRLLKTTKR